MVGEKTIAGTTPMLVTLSGGGGAGGRIVRNFENFLLLQNFGHPGILRGILIFGGKQRGVRLALVRRGDDKKGNFWVGTISKEIVVPSFLRRKIHRFFSVMRH